jgi:hypothetical protein
MVNLPTAGVDYHVPFGGRKASSYGPREQGATRGVLHDGEDDVHRAIALKGLGRAFRLGPPTRAPRNPRPS